MLKESINEGRPVVGVFLSFRGPELVEIAGAAGFDFVIIDAEHGALDWRDVESMIRAAQVSGSTPIVRVPGIDRPAILRSLDLGAGGILVPRINTAADAKAVVNLAMFPPCGDRGFAGSTRAASYGGLNVPEFILKKNESIVVAVQVETPQAVANLDSILSVEGVDVIFVGPSDLSVSLGYPGQSNREPVKSMIRDVLQKTKACSKCGGIFMGKPADAREWAEAGAGFLAIGYTGLIKSCVEEWHAAMRSATG